MTTVMNRDDLLARREQARRKLNEILDMVKTATDASVIDVAMLSLDEVAHDDPGFFEPHYQLACALAALGQKADAHVEFLAAVLRDGRLGGDVDMAFRAYTQLAQREAELGNVEQSVRYLTRFVQHYPLVPEATAVARQASALVKANENWFGIYQAGCRAQLNKEMAKAAENFRQACMVWRACAPAWLRLGMCLRVLGQPDEAVQALQNAADYDPSPRPLIETGLVYAQIGNSYVEENYYRRALELNPNDPLALYQLGAALYARRERGDALEALQQAMALAPDSPFVGKALEIIGLIVKAGAEEYPACIEEPVQYEPWLSDDEGMTFSLPARALRLTPPDRSVLFWVVDREEAPAFSAKLSKLTTPDPFDLETFLRLTEGNVARMTGVVVEHKERLDLFNHVGLLFELRSIAADTVTLQVIFFRDREIFEFRAESPWLVYRKARDVYRHILLTGGLATRAELHASNKRRHEQKLAENPADVDAMLGLADACHGLGLESDAQAWYNKVLKHDARHVRASRGLGMSLWQHGKLDAAIKALEAAAELEPDKELLRTLAQAWEKKGKADRVARVLARAVELSPKDIQLRLQLGKAYMEMRKYELAEQEFSQTLQLDPAEFQGRLLLGNLYRNMKRPEDAIAVLKRAIEIDGQTVDAHLLLGLSYMEGGFFDRAEKSLKEAQMIDYDNATVKQALTELNHRRKGVRKF